jgi:hypothetical protein
MRVLRLILVIPAIVLIFLPYSHDTSPWAAVRGFGGPFGGTLIALLGGPFFLAVLISVVQAQLFLKKNLPGIERVICRTLASAALACGLVILALGIRDSGFDEETVWMLLMFGIPILAAISLMVFARRLGPEKATLVALKAAWLPNAIVCGILFWKEGWQIGAYLAAFTIVLYAVEITLFLTRKETIPDV